MAEKHPFEKITIQYKQHKLEEVWLWLMAHANTYMELGNAEMAFLANKAGAAILEMYVHQNTRR